jgi:protein O-mannosyl-transferase
MKKTRTVPIARRDVPRRSGFHRFREVRLPLLVCALALIVYSRSLFCGFVRDDIPQIVNNRQVQSWDYLPQLLGSHLWSQVGAEWSVLFYRPIFSIWMLLVHTFGGLSPWFWHLSSILLHLAATYLVFRFCLRLTQSEVAAAVAAAVFAVYPIHVDAVTWVSASCELLFTIFALASMLALLRQEGENNQNANPRMGVSAVWVSALWFGAGLFAKETGIALLPILLVFAWLQLKDYSHRGDRIWTAAAPYVAMSVVYFLIRWAVMHRVGVETGEHTWAEVVFSAPSLFLFYLKKLFLPWSLSGCYVNPLTSAPTIGFWLSLLAIALCLAAVCWFAFRSRPLVGLAAALIVIPILPALAVVRIYPQGDMTHDRYLYISTVGVALLVAILFKRLWALEKPVKVAVAALVFALLVAAGAETLAQQRYYQNDVAFYSRVLEISPSDGFVRAMLGNVYLDENRVDLALEQFQQAHQTAPDNGKVTLFLARGLSVAGKYQEADLVLNGLLQTPNLAPRRRNSTLLSLANVQIALGKLDYAQLLLQQVEQNDDSFPELHWALGVLYQKQGLLPQALAAYQKEVEITGDALAQQRSAQLVRLIYSQSSHSSPFANSSR